MKFVYCVLQKTFEHNDSYGFHCSTFVSGVYSTLEGAQRCQKILVNNESYEILDDDYCNFPEFRVQVSSSKIVYYVIDKVPFDL